MSRLLSSQISDAEYARRVMVARPAIGTPPAALLDPTWWAHVAVNFTPGDRIEVLPQDGAYDLDLRVVEAGRNWARVRVLRAWPEDILEAGAISPAANPAEGFIVEWGGPAHKWRVVRASDRAVIAHGYESREAAGQMVQRAA